MKKITTALLSVALCGAILVAAPLAVSYAEEPEEGASSSSASSQPEEDLPGQGEGATIYTIEDEMDCV